MGCIGINHNINLKSEITKLFTYKYQVRKYSKPKSRRKIHLAEGAVVTEEQACRPQELKIYKRIAIGVDESSLQFAPDRPNRNSLLGGDKVNNSAETTAVKKAITVKTIVKSHQPDLVKIDIEGSEVPLFHELAACAKKTQGKSRKKKNPMEGVQELLVYYHYDKFPKLAVLQQFLKNLERLYKHVEHEPHPGFPPHWERKLRKNRELKMDFRNIGLAAKKQDILVYCWEPRA